MTETKTKPKTKKPDLSESIVVLETGTGASSILRGNPADADVKAFADERLNRANLGQSAASPTSPFMKADVFQSASRYLNELAWLNKESPVETIELPE